MTCNRCLGLSRKERREFLAIWQRDARRKGFQIETVATADGLVSIAAHYAAQGTISGLCSCLGIDVDEIEREYGFAAADAAEKLAGHLHGNDLLTWMAAALHRHEKEKDAR